MDWQNKIKGNVVNAGDYVGKFISTNGHAQQAFPAMHRAAAVGGMYLGWKGGDKLRDALFAVNKTSEGGYDEIKREEIPFILRPLYHKIDWTPLSDKPSDKWKEILYDVLPAAGAAAGTVAGSMSIFHFNGRAGNYAKYKDPKTNITIMQAVDATQYAKGGVYSAITAAFSGFSADSMLLVLQGMGLNKKFLAHSGNANNIFNYSGGNLAPPKALFERIAKIPFYAKSALNSDGKINPDWSKIFVDRVLKPVYAKKLDTPEKKAKIQKVVHDTFQEVFDKHKKNLSGEELIKAVSKDMEQKISNIDHTINETGKIISHGFDKYAQEILDFKIEDVDLGKSTTAVSFKNRLLEQRDLGSASMQRSS